MAALGGIYLGQSVIGGLIFQSLPAVLRAGGMGLGLLSLVPLFMLPHALKFAWAPAVERWRIGPEGLRRSRTIILWGQLLCVALMLGLLVPAGPVVLFSLLAGLALVSATIDIACDAFATEQLPPKGYTTGNGVQVGSAYLGAVVGGGAFLVVLQHAGWQVAILMLGLALLLAGLPLWRIPEVPLAIETTSPTRPNLRDALGRPLLRRGMLVVAVNQFGLRAAMALSTPFLVDAGLKLDTLGIIKGAGGVAAGLVGTVLGARLASRFGPARMLPILLFAQLAAFAGFAVIALLPGISPFVPAGLSVATGCLGGATFVTLYAAMMGWARGPQPGVDFSLLQCTDALVASAAGFGALALASRVGFFPVFALAAFIALGAALILPRFLAGEADDTA